MTKNITSSTTSSSTSIWLKIIQAYSWSIYFLSVLIAIVTLCKSFFGEYPFNVSEVLLFCYTNYSFLVNETTGTIFLIIFALFPIIVTAWLLKKQGHSQLPSLTPKNFRVRIFFATIIMVCFLVNALPTYTCHNALCDYVPLVASFPGLVVGIPLAQGVDQAAMAIGGVIGELDFRPLVIVPNGIIVWLLVFYFLTPKEKLPKILRRRWLILVLAVGALLLAMGYVLMDLETKFFRLTDEELRSLVTQNAPAAPPGLDFEFKVGDVIIQRPQGETQDLVAKLSGTNLAHTDTYCGGGEIINANGADLLGTGGINIDKLVWEPRYVGGALPTRVVMRHPDPMVGEELCRKLREVEADDETTFGLDLLNKRKTYNCSNIVLYQLDPEVKDFNLVTPDLVFVYMLEHDWQLLNWSN